MSSIDQIESMYIEYQRTVNDGDSNKILAIESLFSALPHRTVIPLLRDRIEGRSRIIMVLCEAEAEQGHLDDHAFEERDRMYRLNDNDFTMIALMKGLLIQPSATSVLYDETQGLKEENPSLKNISISRYLQRTMTEGYEKAYYSIEHVVRIRPDPEMYPHIFEYSAKNIATVLNSANKSAARIDLLPLFHD